ncbi:MAG: DUF3822 family protein [Bacteroidetes bacterium]|nr:DUF3822 family protein [Bacteroidota bacterium]
MLLHDPSLDEQTAPHCHLAIEFSDNTVTLSVLDLARRSFLAVALLQSNDPKGNPDDLKPSGLISGIPWLKFKFQSVSAAAVTNIFTLVPDAVFDAGHASGYLDYQFGNRNLSKVYWDRLREAGLYVIYSIPDDLAGNLKSLFPGVKPVHHSSILLRSYNMHFSGKENPNVFLHFDDGYYSLTVLSGRSILYFNTFPFETAEDAAYYTFFTLNQVKVNPSASDFTLFGNIDKNSPVFNLLRQYVKNLSFGHYNSFFTFSPYLSEISLHRFFRILNQYSALTHEDHNRKT